MIYGLFTLLDTDSDPYLGTRYDICPKIGIVATRGLSLDQNWNLMPCSHLTFAFASTSPLDAPNGFRPILCIFVCIAIDAMLNFDSDVDANADTNVKCEHSLSLCHVNIFHTVQCSHRDWNPNRSWYLNPCRAM